MSVEYCTVMCDKCHNDIYLHGTDIYTRDIGVDYHDKPVTETYFICPTCKAKYTVSVTDDYLRFMIANPKHFSKAERRAKELELREQYKAEIEEG